MEHKLQDLKKRVLKELDQVKDAKILADLKNKYLGRKGELAALLKDLKSLAEEEKPKVGKVANQVKDELSEIFNRLEDSLLDKVDSFAFDPTLPGSRRQLGHLHPLTQVQEEIEQAFLQIGFTVFDGPQVESEYYNFNALNIPADHPARDTQDTFWLEDGNLLRTQTSNLQVRMLEKYGAPFRGIFPGRVFRNESTDPGHDHTFHQLEGLMVDKAMNIGHLIATMKALLSTVFNAEVDLRLRPGFFPFVEPAFEMDIKCMICEGKGCSVCKQSGWVELMPCGMVHPEVIKAGGLDPQIYSGFAFGLGLTRLVMMKYRINDIRLLMSADLRFLNQF
ncbi:MAG: phenylalanine--tRNA ligase subunit alpha [Patescibacteria group bacterium]